MSIPHLGDQALQLARYVESGGPMIWPLLAASVWAWTLILRKGRQLALWRREERSGKDVIAQALAGPVPPGPGDDPNAWQWQLVREFLARRTGDQPLDERLLHRLGHRFQDAADQGVTTILIFAAVAPLLGLLGTVTGMIDAFDALAAWGSASPRALSGGISEALISTQTGLLVAIPVLFAGQFLRRRAQTFKARVDRFCTALSREFLTRSAARQEGEPA
ncbi:MAG: MotA/TolQ/ExbB proton channel family protein [Desulfovibrio sp.]|nr:MotA/TolQ/ExbB proton channel family protein [Desulfovibrio sp.]